MLTQPQLGRDISNITYTTTLKQIIQVNSIA